MRCVPDPLVCNISAFLTVEIVEGMTSTSLCYYLENCQPSIAGPNVINMRQLAQPTQLTQLAQ